MDQTWDCAVTKEEGVKEKTFDLGKAQYVIGYGSKPQAIILMKGIWWLNIMFMGPIKVFSFFFRKIYHKISQEKAPKTTILNNE